MRALAAVAILVAVPCLAGCGTATGPVISASSRPGSGATPSPTASAPAPQTPSPIQSPTPTPSIPSNPLAHLPSANLAPFKNPQVVSCTGNPGPTDPVAVVMMHGQSNYVLRDYANEDHPTNVCTFGVGVVIDAILDPHHVMTLANGNPAIVEIPSGTFYELSLAATAYAVAPDASQVLWLSLDAVTLHDSWDGNDSVLQQYQATLGRCGSPDTDSKSIQFTRDGQYAYALWEQNFADTSYLNVVHNHQNVFTLAPPPAGWGSKISGGPLMAVWSPAGETLYFTKLGDIWSWNPNSGAVDLRTGLRWIDPSISPDGTHIVYAVRDSSGTPTVHLMDPATGATGAQVGGAGRDLPYFLTKDLIWVHADVPGCSGSQPNSYVYDLRTHSEYPSVLDGVAATWPAASALGG